MDNPALRARVSLVALRWSWIFVLVEHWSAASAPPDHRCRIDCNVIRMFCDGLPEDVLRRYGTFCSERDENVLEYRQCCLVENYTINTCKNITIKSGPGTRYAQATNSGGYTWCSRRENKANPPPPYNVYLYIYIYLFIYLYIYMEYECKIMIMY
jgi:hypothetical protein